METKGIEQSLLKPSKTAISKKSGAISSALDNKNDADLARLVQVWQTLPEHVKTEINQLIEKYSTTL